jgi:precorrin-6B methylase 2
MNGRIVEREHPTPFGTIVERGPEALLADHATRFTLDHLAVVPGSLVAEPGCGSAVMSLYAAMAGARRVVGTDTDREAVRVARSNAEANGLESVEIREGSLLEPVEKPLDLVIALLPHKPGPVPFNPRYDGGRDGTRWLARVIDQSATRLNEGGRLVLYLNSIANPSKVLERFGEGFEVSLLGEKKRYFTREEFDHLAPGMCDHLWAQRAKGEAEFHEDGEGLFFWARLYEGFRLRQRGRHAANEQEIPHT